MKATAINGLAAAKRRLAALPPAMRAAAHEALRRMGDDVLAAAKLALRPEPGPAPPGEPPADPEGRLGGSLVALLDPVTDRMTVASTSPHAVFLEYGTRRMGARPFLRPAVEAARAEALGHARDAVAQVAEETP